ncbi:MAG: glycoside hydrolase family 88 protein [Nibricoccus sp.]
MKTKHLIPLALATVLTLVSTASAALEATGPFKNRDNPNPDDDGEGSYGIPYQLPTTAEITEVLHRVRGYMEKNTFTRVIDGKTRKEITDFTTPVATARADAGPSRFSLLAYEMGVVYSGMLYAAEVTGDKRFNEFTASRLQFIHDRLPYFRAQDEKFKLERANSFRGPIDPRALDDCGSMCAALIRARIAKVGPDLKPTIDLWSDYIATKQFRFADGTLARQRPQAESLWADDAYMSIPALAEMGHLTGDKKWFDDAVKNATQMFDYLWNKDKKILTHGYNTHNPDAPHFHWARANGWVVVALCDLLDVLPKDHPGYELVKTRLVSLLTGLAEYQNGFTGLWHQMVDRPDSYLETSASAMFVYGLAHAINQGWISPTTYGSIAQVGWIGVTTRILKDGAVDGTCVGTTFASDEVYYYHRPANTTALHGYGPVLLAGAEMIKLINNPKLRIDIKLRTYHYVPLDGRPTSYREH